MKRNVLRGKIVEKCGTIQEFCDRANFVRSTFDRKLSGETDFTIGDVRRIVNALDLTEQELCNIFFADEVA